MKANIQYKCKLMQCCDSMYYDYELIIRYKGFINDTYIKGKIKKRFDAYDNTFTFLNESNDEGLRTVFEDYIRGSIKKKHTMKKQAEKDKAQKTAFHKRFNKDFSKWTNCEIEVDLDES